MCVSFFLFIYKKVIIPLVAFGFACTCYKRALVQPCGITVLIISLNFYITKNSPHFKMLDKMDRQHCGGRNRGQNLGQLPFKDMLRFAESQNTSCLLLACFSLNAMYLPLLAIQELVAGRRVKGHSFAFLLPHGLVVRLLSWEAEVGSGSSLANET